MRSGTEQCGSQIQLDEEEEDEEEKEKEKEEEKQEDEEEERKATEIKSNNPHLAGGEQGCHTLQRMDLARPFLVAPAIKIKIENSLGMALSKVKSGSAWQSYF